VVDNRRKVRDFDDPNTFAVTGGRTYVGVGGTLTVVREKVVLVEASRSLWANMSSRAV
jgi:hypothetical protein